MPCTTRGLDFNALCPLGDVAEHVPRRRSRLDKATSPSFAHARCSKKNYHAHASHFKLGKLHVVFGFVV